MKVFCPVLAGLFLLSSGLVSASGKAKACQPTLEQCPLTGCAKKNTPNALTNIIKHGHKLSGEPRALTFADFASLQQQLDDRFHGKYSTLTEPDRMRLRDFRIGGKKVGEGAFVEITGFIAVKPGKSKPHANTGESVNCNLTGSSNNDFHINLTPKPDDSEYNGIVVEMIPQDRNEKWTEKRLRAVQQAGLMVRARGQLMLDNHHFVNKDPDKPKGTQPKRFSLFEVHPIVEFDVCTAKTCSADSSSWQPLEEWTPPSGSGKKKTK